MGIEPNVSSIYDRFLACNITRTHTQPFYGSLDFVRDNLGELVPEETFTHSHLSSSSVIPYLLHLLRSMASSLLNLHAWQAWGFSLFIFRVATHLENLE